jgi:hypothetical protein
MEAALVLVPAMLLLFPPGAGRAVGNAVTSEDGEVGATFPCLPEPVAQERPRPDGGVAISHGFKCSDPDYYAALEYVDMPPSEVDPQTVLDAARDGAIARNAKRGARLVSEQRLTVSGHPGRDIVVRASGDLFMRMRLCVARDHRRTRLVLLTYVTRAPGGAGARIDAFLGSLRLKAPAGKR